MDSLTCTVDITNRYYVKQEVGKSRPRIYQTLFSYNIRLAPLTTLSAECHKQFAIQLHDMVLANKHDKIPTYLSLQNQTTGHKPSRPREGMQEAHGGPHQARWSWWRWWCSRGEVPARCSSSTPTMLRGPRCLSQYSSLYEHRIHCFCCSSA
ncbi:unnamed protein product, partial [Musa acuminata var. zebrina]